MVPCDNNATSWPILQAETCQIFSYGEIPKWAEFGEMPENKLSQWGWWVVGLGLMDCFGRYIRMHIVLCKLFS